MIEIAEFAMAAFSFIGGAGIVSGLTLRGFDRMNKKLDNQETARVNESVVLMKGVQAIGHLSEATALAQQRGHCNGEMDTAIKYYKDSKDSLNEYLLKNAAQHTHGR